MNLTTPRATVETLTALVPLLTGSEPGQRRAGRAALAALRAASFDVTCCDDRGIWSLDDLRGDPDDARANGPDREPVDVDALDDPAIAFALNMINALPEEVVEALINEAPILLGDRFVMTSVHPWTKRPGGGRCVCGFDTTDPAQARAHHNRRKGHTVTPHVEHGTERTRTTIRVTRVQDGQLSYTVEAVQTVITPRPDNPQGCIRVGGVGGMTLDYAHELLDTTAPHRPGDEPAPIVGTTLRRFDIRDIPRED